MTGSMPPTCTACPDGQFTISTSNARVCTTKSTCPTNNQYAYFPVESNNAVKDKDDAWCRPRCSPGEYYAQRPVSYPSLGDECLPCPRNFYQDAAYPHTRACSACQLGKFTSSEGASNANSCKMPQVIPYRSTHRIWYFFGTELKVNTDCMQTFIGTRGLASNKGVAAIRDPQYSQQKKKPSSELTTECG